MMNFCPECGVSLEGVQGRCPNCDYSIEEIGVELQPTAKKIRKKSVFNYTHIINLISLLQHNFYLVFIFTMLLFITFSFVPQWGWLILLISLIAAYWFANEKTAQSLNWNQKIEVWLTHQLSLVPDKLDEFDNYTQQVNEGTRQLYHSVKDKAQAQVVNIKESYQQSPLRVSKTAESTQSNDTQLDEKNQPQSVQAINETGSLRRRRRQQAQARTKQQISNQPVDSSEAQVHNAERAVRTESHLSMVIYLILVSLSLFVYYQGISRYSLFDFNASVLWNSYQQRTFTMGNVIEALGYGAMFDSSGQSELYQIIFTVVAYYLPIVYAVLSFFRSKVGGFVQLIISIVMGASMAYLIYLAIDASLFVNYGNDYGSFSTDLGIGSLMILGSIVLMTLCSLYKMVKGN